MPTPTPTKLYLQRYELNSNKKKNTIPEKMGKKKIKHLEILITIV